MNDQIHQIQKFHPITQMSFPWVSFAHNLTSKLYALQQTQSGSELYPAIFFEGAFASD